MCVLIWFRWRVKNLVMSMLIIKMIFCWCCMCSFSTISFWLMVFFGLFGLCGGIGYCINIVGMNSRDIRVHMLVFRVICYLNSCMGMMFMIKNDRNLVMVVNVVMIMG